MSTQSFERRFLGMLGFVVLGLSPSFVDWQQSPEKRWQILGFYGVGLALVYCGVFARGQTKRPAAGGAAVPSGLAADVGPVWDAAASSLRETHGGN